MASRWCAGGGYDERGMDSTNDEARVMNRAELQWLARDRIKNAKALLDAPDCNSACAPLCRSRR